MRFRNLSSFYRCSLIGLASGAVLLSGCALSNVGVPAAGPIVASVALNGNVHGGQQPVSGATIQLYAASTAGYAAAAYTLLTTTVTSNSSGAFTITGSYSCPSSNSQVYITATGGNSGSGINPNLALMAAVGACGNLNASTFISINELTTVASVWALAPFMSSYTNVGTSASNVQGLVNAFAAVNKLASISAGTVPGTALPAGATAPTSEMNTLADILAACVNTAGGNGACTTLFTAATAAGSAAPTDTIGAALNIAKNPSLNVQTLYNLASAQSPFQPTLATQPSDWTISVTYTAGGINVPSGAAVDPFGSLWVTNSAGNSVSVLTSAGTPAPGSPYSVGGMSGPSAIAIDATGGAWVTNKTSSSVTALSATGIPLSFSPRSGGGLSAPTGVSIDGEGFIWITNSGNSTVTKLSPDGSLLSGFGFTGGGINAPAGIAINPQ